VASARHPVFIVDDDLTSCRFMAEVLEQAGYATEWTTDDESAGERIRRKPYSLVVADITMPTVPGTAIVAEVARVSPGLPTLLVSAFADGEARAEAHRLGVPLLTKPFKAETFLATVHALVSDAEPEVAHALVVAR
jgi:two-component system response regulator FlrC